MRGLAMVGAAALGLLTAGEAGASGGLNCDGSAGKMRFEIGSGVTRGMGGATFQFQGAIETADETVEEDMRRIEFAQENLAQYWLDGKELRLVVYRERPDGDFGYVELTVLTKAGEGDDEGIYAGTFEATWFETRDDKSAEGRRMELGGAVSCFVE